MSAEDENYSKLNSSLDQSNEDDEPLDIILDQIQSTQLQQWISQTKESVAAVS